MIKIIKLFLFSGILVLSPVNTEQSLASDIFENNMLIIGARPWDANIQGVDGIEKAHYVDFMIGQAAPQTLPSNFHNYDLNDSSSFGSGKFSEFTQAQIGKFKTIIIDWATYQHIRRDQTWEDLSTLLSKGGSLIIPVTSVNMMSGKSQSSQKAQDIVQKITKFFQDVKIYSHNEMPTYEGLSLLKYKRPCDEGRFADIITMEPAIIFATK